MFSPDFLTAHKKNVISKLSLQISQKYAPHVPNFNFMCLFPSQGLPLLPLPHSENSKFAPSVPPRSAKVQPWGFSREKCPTWFSCKGSGSQCHFSQKATCLHGKYVFRYHPFILTIFSYFCLIRSPASGFILPSILSRVFIHVASALLLINHFVICLELQGHATKNQDLLLASGTISLKGSDGLSAVDDDIMAAVSLVITISFI